jgi:GT2 family glycosyltransferase
MTAAPVASVVVPTHNRSDSLRRLLTALAAQSVGADRFEVVVVADGCADGTVMMLRNWGGPLRLTICEQTGEGAAAARNRGAQAATGDILIFLDDDMEPVPGLVEGYVRALAGGAHDVALGPSVPVLAPPIDLFRITLRLWWADLLDTLAAPGHRFSYRDMLSGNLALGARLFRQVGGFDAALRCREDHELGVRLIRAGAAFTWVPGASALHHDATDLDRSLERARQEGRGDMQIARRYPGLLPTLPIGACGADGLPAAGLGRLAVTHPSLGRAFARQMRGMLGPLEQIRARRRWRSLYGAVRSFWYWRGVAEEAGSPVELQRLTRRHASLRVGAGRAVELDLQLGLEATTALLDRIRPAGARIRHGWSPVGVIKSDPSREQLRGEHLRPLLATQFAAPLLTAMALARATPDEAHQSHLMSLGAGR